MDEWKVNTGKYRLMSNGEVDLEFDESRRHMAERKARFWGAVKFVSFLVSIVVGLIAIGFLPRLSDVVTKPMLHEVMQAQTKENALEHRNIEAQLHDIKLTTQDSLKSIDAKLWELVKRKNKKGE